MKIFLIIYFITLSLFLKAQIFIEISNGYAFPLQKLTLAYPYFNGSSEYYRDLDPLTHTMTRIIKKKPAKINFGTGYLFNGSIGYYIGKYLGVLITYNCNNTLNDFNNNKKTYYYESIYDGYGNIVFKQELSFAFNSYTKSYVLNSIFKYSINKKISSFIKLGISRSIHEIFVNRVYSWGVVGLVTSTTNGFKEKYYGNYSIGGNLCFGTTYNIKNFAFLFECKFIIDKYTPARLFSYDYYDTDIFNNIPADHETLLEDYCNGGDYKNNEFDPLWQGNAQVRYKNTFAYSTFSVNLGIQYTLRFKKKNKK